MLLLVCTKASENQLQESLNLKCETNNCIIKIKVTQFPLEQSCFLSVLLIFTYHKIQ